MKSSLLTTSFLILLIAAVGNRADAGPGDTTSIRVHDTVHMSWWGQYNQWAVFPAQTTPFRRINLDVTLGCPYVGCSDWDYTVQIEARHKTGTYDSTLVPAPYYTIGTTSPDTIWSNLNPVYVTFYDSIAGITDSVLANQFWVMIHNNPNDPFQITDSIFVYPGNYYNYTYGSGGVIIDSILIGSGNTLINSFTATYNVFEVIENIELARVITPYGGYYAVSWKDKISFDITDLAPILHDSVEIRVFYGGWSDGFSITLDFHFIEGIPPRTPLSVRNIYSSGPGGFPYGNTSNPIENYLIPKSFPIDAGANAAMLRIIPTGHGAGTQNCAEFCPKNYRVKINGTQQFQQSVWRSDCGLNHLMHQAGTWIYDRANWCPGDRAFIYNHEITPWITPGNPVTIDMDFDVYTNSMAGQNPNYILATQLITYGAPNFNNDVAMEEIISPSSDYYHNRSNPICNNPVIKIRNTGSNVLTSALITYGIEGATPSTFVWSGNLDFNKIIQVQLGAIDWNSLTGQSDRFYVYVSSPNGVNDEYAFNDTMRTKILFPPQHPSTFVLLFKTNSAYFETTYNITDDQGNVVFTNGLLVSNTIYRDTVTLAPGCYTFNVNDSGKDGLSFFANNDGTGYTRFVNAFGPGVFQYFESDFGTNIRHRFTVGYVLYEPEVLPNSLMNVFPNPTEGAVNIDLAYPGITDGEVMITDITGKPVFSQSFSHSDNPLIRADLTTLSPGIYLVHAIANGNRMTRKLVLQPYR